MKATVLVVLTDRLHHDPCSYPPLTGTAVRSPLIDSERELGVRTFTHTSVGDAS